MPGKYDHLTTSQLWDLIYSTAKNVKKNRRVWNILMSPDYALVVHRLAKEHLSRMSRELYAMGKGSPDYELKLKAYKFIQGIQGKATAAIERHIHEQKNVRRYEDINLLLDYVEYLKDTIEDLSEFIPSGYSDAQSFELSTTIQNYENDVATPLYEWIRKRRQRRAN